MQRKSLVERLNFNNVIQTNGTLLPKDRALFLTQMGFDIGISIDGPEFKHNDQRFVDEASFNQLKSRLLTLAKPIPFAVFLVIHEGNVDSGKEILSFLRNLAPQNGVSFIPRFNRDSHLDPKQYSDFLIDLFDLWWPERLPYIALFENFITGLEGQLPRFCFLNDGCAAFVSLDSGGTVYATCQPREEVKVGSIGENGFRELILRHRSTVKRIIGGIRSESLGLRLGVDSPSFFPGKGCPKRLVGNRDPYVDTFAEVIKHIGKRLGLEVLDDGQKR